MHVISYQRLARDVLKLVPFCLEHDISAIFGAPRSGMLPATMLAAALQLPLGMAGGSLAAGRRVKASPRRCNGPALILEDTVNNGGGIRTAKIAMKGTNYLTACVYTKPQSVELVDFAAVVLEGPRFYEWNIFNCDATKWFMCDLDGVFCHDPKVYDDDGPKYARALARAVPKYVSTWAVGWICTNRIKRWREVTMKWLQRQRIAVLNELYMQPHGSAEERRASSTSASFKAWCYGQEKGCHLFIESHDRIAEEIFERSGRPVLSVESMRLWQ